MLIINNYIIYNYMVKKNILFNQFTFKKLSNYIINPYNTIKNSEKILKPSNFFYKNLNY